MKARVLATVLVTSLLAPLGADADRKRREVMDDEEDDQDGPEARSALAIKLDDLIDVAVRLSPDLARSKNDRLAAKGQATAARRDQQWTVAAGAQFERLATDPETSVGPFNIANENKLTANLGVGRNLPSGGNVGLDFAVLRTLRELELPDPLTLSAQNMGGGQGVAISDEYTLTQAQAKLTFRQPLARGFGSDIALAQQNKSDLAFTEASVRTQLAAEELIRDVVAGYWELAYAAYEVQTRADALELARKHDETTRLEIRANTAPQGALDAVGYELAVREEALLDARNQYERKSLELRKKVGLELGRRDIVMRPLDPFQVDTEEWDVEEVLARVRRGNRQLAALILAKRQAEIDVKVARNAMLPQVDLTVSGALYGSGDTPDRAFTGATNGGNFLVTAGLTVQFDIGGAARGTHDAARARRQRIEIDQADVQRTLETEVVLAVRQVTSARARVALSERAVLAAEKNVKAERASFQAQRSTNFNVMQRQSELVTAQLRRGRAIADYHVAVAQVQFLGGTLLDRYDIDVRPLARSKR
jgi:outer membrane protein TolC